MAHPPVGFAALHDGFPLNLKARISAAVGGEAVCSLGTTFTRVMRKRLMATDLSPHHGRLSIPGKENARELLEILTDEEWSELKMGEKIKLRFFLGPDLEVASPDEGSSCLAMWEMARSTVFAVTGGGWRWVLKEIGRLDMRCDDVIQLWSFRLKTQGSSVSYSLPPTRED
ncbi:unnamed protein product [Linum trigynum]|uniref:TF-B3 domain-containing protein n=1 Tax=Linum trigynum TaxID=586398 RepID=A0AAV2EJ63_9ROSI